MEGRRRFKGDNFNKEAPKTNNRKPPVGNWQPTVPSWEKKFCTLVGKVPWRKILDAKKFMHYHDNVVKWNDSAGEEAFNNAKSCFYARMHGLPCEVPVPDPNLYIDEIDWDCKIDQELILDLEREPGDPDTDRKDENIVIFGDILLQNQGFSSFGWGDCEDELKAAPNSSNVNNDNSWEPNYSQNNGHVKDNGLENFGNNSWGWYNNNETAMVGYEWGDGWGNSGWGDGWNNSWGWYQYGNYYAPEYVLDPNGVYGTWCIDDGNREGTGSYMSGYETSRHHGDNYQRNQSRRNANSARKRVNFASEQRTTDKGTASRGNLKNSCAPVIHQASGKARNLWSMEKPFS